jgi:molybdopterin-guanine dinucleotide biosynthesis protein B
MRPIISIVGKSESGKTTLLESLIKELKQRGYKIAVIKHAHGGFELDKKSKDSWRFIQAGTDVVGVSSPTQVAVIKQLERDLEPWELSYFIRWDYDLLITEGFKRSSSPMIEVHRKDQGKDLVAPPRQLLAVVTDEPLDVDVPQFSKEDIRGLADLIEKHVQEKQKGEDVELYINDEHIPLNPFVKSLITNTLVGMVESLKKVGEVNNLHISLRRKH